MQGAGGGNNGNSGVSDPKQTNDSTYVSEATEGTDASKETEVAKGTKVTERPAEKVSDEPVKLTMLFAAGDLSDEEFEMYYVKPTKEQHPNITLELVKGTNISDRVAANMAPDIVYTNQAKMHEVVDLDLQWDLRDMIKKYDVNMDAFDPLTIEGILSESANGEIYGFPFSQNFSALFYNKDIFDRFSVPYPEGQMSWDQILELGRAVGRMDGDIQYEALFPGTLWQFAQQLSAQYTDPKTDEPTLTTDAWKTAAEYYKKIYGIPGNEKAALGNFFGTRNLAMTAIVGNSIIGADIKALASGSPLNWDIAPYPNFPESVGKSMRMAPQILMITSTSKHKEQAFQVLSVVTEYENQLKMSRSGRNTILADATVMAQFGLDSPSLKDKAVKNIFLNTPTAPENGKFDVPVRKLINRETPKLIDGSQDVNTFLRTVQELAAITIEAEKEKLGK